MNIQQIEQDSTIQLDNDMPTPATPAMPHITDEEYAELLQLRHQQLNHKSAGYDLRVWIEETTKELEEARQKLTKTEGELSEVSVLLQKRFTEIVSPFGIEGAVVIADTSPHYITKQK